MFNVTGSVTSASTYSKVACTYVTGAGSFSDGDKISTTFIRGGDKGTTGSTGTASSGFHYQFETATSDADQGAGKIWLNNSTVASASVLYIDDDDNDGTDISAFTATWDDSSATSDKGFIKIQSRATPTDYAVFKISSSGTDNTAYWEFPVTHLVSAGTLSDTEVVDVFFTRSGDSGGVANRTVDTMTGDASDTTLSLSQSPGSTNNCTCFIDGVGQHPGTDFNISGSTLTFTTAPPTGAIVVAICGGNESIGTPSDDTVTLAKMAVNSIDSDQYVDGSIDAVHLSANSVDSDAYVDGSIDLAHIATNQIDETLMKDAFVGDFSDVTVTAADAFLYGDATDSGNTKKDTVQGILDLVSGGDSWTQATPIATASGTSITFGSLPAGLSMIFVHFDGVSTDSTGNMDVQIGDGGGIETSGYIDTSESNQAGTHAFVASSDAFTVATDDTGDTVHGQMILARLDSGHEWTASHVMRATGNGMLFGGGSKDLSAELTQVLIKTSSGNFDAGRIGLSYI
jgi:hypothetical protein